MTADRLLPQCFVYTDETQDSAEAIRLLEQAGIRFQEMPAPKEAERQIPYLISREGDFVGIGDPETDARSINAFIHLLENRPH